MRFSDFSGVKVLGRSIGSVGKPSDVDGDGDGFLTGPDGRDNVPAPAKRVADGVRELAAFVDQLERDASRKFGDIRNPVNAERAMREVFPNRVVGEKSAMFPVRDDAGKPVVRDVDVGRLALLLHAGQQDKYVADRLGHIGVSGDFVGGLFGGNLPGVFAYGLIDKGAEMDKSPFVAGLDFSPDLRVAATRDHGWGLSALKDMEEADFPEADRQRFLGAYLAAHEWGHAQHILRVLRDRNFDIQAKSNDELEANVRAMAEILPWADVEQSVGIAKSWGVVYTDEAKGLSEAEQYRRGLLYMIDRLEQPFVLEALQKDEAEVWDGMSADEVAKLAGRFEGRDGRARVSGYAAANALEFFAERLSMDVMGHEGHTPEGWEKVRKWVNTKALPRKRVRGGKSTLKRLKGFHPDLDGRWRPFCGGWKP